MQILIIDNDQDTVTTLKALLDGEANIMADVAYSYEEALTLMRSDSNDYNLVMLDIMMPGKSGLDLARDMSQEDKLKDVPVLIMSSALPLPPDQFLEFVQKDAAMASIKGAIEKPFMMEEVLTKIKSLAKK